VNGDVLSTTEIDAITKLFCSDTVGNDDRIFSDPDDENAKALYVKKSENLCFVPVDDAWYDPIRKLSE
jgi:phosphonate transport system substrate-binding protein